MTGAEEACKMWADFPSGNIVSVWKNQHRTILSKEDICFKLAKSSSQVSTKTFFKNLICIGRQNWASVNAVNGIFFYGDNPDDAFF